jgi:hypothetical protein
VLRNRYAKRRRNSSSSRHGPSSPSVLFEGGNTELYDDHAFEQPKWVELRGFEPLTPSMRTERLTRQTCSSETYPQLRCPIRPLLTAPDRV